MTGKWPTTVAALLLLTAGLARADDKLVRPLGDSEVDWAAGTITAHGGAAADLRVPSADVARPGAERRARAAALAKLRAALQAMPLGTGKLSAAALEAALGRAHAASVDYQSNGGVLLTMSLAFGEVSPPQEKTDKTPKTPSPDGGAETARKVPEQALSVASMPFELAPRVAAGEREAALSWAVYRTGAPPAGVEAIAVHRDRAGRLQL